MVKTSLMRFLLGFLLLVFAAEAVYAQRPNAPPEWRAERDRLKRLIETTHEVLAAYHNEQAQGLLAKAEALTQEIDQKIAAQKYAHAMVLIREAIAILEKALKLALDSPLLRLHTRVQELMQRAETEVLGSNNREAIRLVQEARKNKLLGEQAVARTQPLQAAQYFQVAIALLERALKLVGGNPGGDGNPVDLVNRGRDYFVDLKKQLEERLRSCANPAGQRLYNQTQRQERLAEEASRRGDFALALQLYNGATRLLLRALDLCPAQSQNADQLGAELTLLRELMASAEEQVLQSNNPRDRAMLDWAQKLMLEAEAALAGQKPIIAYGRLERSRRLVEKVLRNKTQTPIDYQKQCEESLQQLRADLAETQEEINASNNTEAQSFFELAQKAGAEAERICQRQPHALLSLAAFRAMLRLGHQLLLQSETFLQENTPAIQDRAAIQQRLNQLDATIAEVRSNLTNEQKDFATMLLTQAVVLRDRAQAAFQRGQFYLSAELCDLAFELLRETLKLGK